MEVDYSSSCKFDFVTGSQEMRNQNCHSCKISFLIAVLPL